jgi:hypothetical protein
MIRHRHRRAVGAVITSVCVVVLAACSSSSTPSSPKGPTAPALAMYYDQLAGSLTDSDANAEIVAQGVEIFNGVIADGFVPQRAAVIVNGNPSVWYADAATFVDDSSSDSIQVVAMWSDTTADTIVIGFYQNNLSLLQAIVRGGDLVTAIQADSGADADTGSVVLGLTNGNCNLTAITNVYPSFPTYDPTSFGCQAGSGHFDFVGSFPPGDTTASGGLQTVIGGLSKVIAARLQALTDSSGSPPLLRVPRGHVLSRRLLSATSWGVRRR